ncbi:hypothetical protein DY000_02055140 [Brassica cretica]|uniref:Uncharacterized protein n=1 Tax=Brassica cretica TaxID=69181 RepID=A0ABQ7AET8_BRACR|nr:hypothetical protein DY000_02055140 [Brassica cretica]
MSGFLSSSYTKLMSLLGFASLHHQFTKLLSLKLSQAHSVSGKPRLKLRLSSLINLLCRFKSSSPIHQASLTQALPSSLCFWSQARKLTLSMAIDVSSDPFLFAFMYRNVFRLYGT